ncbi:hypothetical protein BDZ45DRAFT_809019 [Acephala macrosclerotiorum]|nr:hypothetical protein BDZ45DRAFT_809019 [Acephala macrosclerotiorum]
MVTTNDSARQIEPESPSSLGTLRIPTSINGFNWYRIKPAFFLNESGDICIWELDVDYYWRPKPKDEDFGHVIDKNRQEGRRTEEPTSLDRILEDAKEKFPDLEPVQAFNEHVKQDRVGGVFYLNDEGKRCMWGPDVDYFMSKWYYGRAFRERSGRRDKKYDVRYRKPTIRSVDRPKAKDITVLAAHPSEKGPKLLQDRENHFLKIAPEIRLHILELAVTAPREETVFPDLVTCNWDGKYTEIRLVYCKAIDATCLRVCQQLYQEGIKALYGQNWYSFDMVNTYFHNCPPSYIGGKIKVWRPSPQEPEPENLNRDVTRVIPMLEDQLHFVYLPGWIYYDPFLRFIYTISPRNCLFLTSLAFHGYVKTL